MTDETQTTGPTPAPLPAEPPAETTATYKDDDFVYVHPDERKVVGRVEWNKNGNAKELAMPDTVVEETDEKPAKGKGAKGGFRRRKRYFPWGTYKSMKAIYKLEGKVKKDEPNRTLDEVMSKAVEQPFWD